jgi:hypothetical protein
MEDKEVGELWEWAAVISPVDGRVDNREVVELIRKLVEERALRDERALSAILRDDFDIDPETFKR